MKIGIGRRQFISALGGGVVAWPLAARAQQPSGMRRIGFLASGLGSDNFSQNNMAAFSQGLDAHGWKEDVNLHIDWRWWGADAALARRQAAELVTIKPDVILAGGNNSVEEILRQTKTIPVVFTLVSDPVGMGYIESLAHPGGNITGFSSYDPPIYTKQLQMFADLTPPATTIAVLYNPETAPYASRMIEAIEDGAKAIGLKVHKAPCHDDAEIEVMMAALAQGGGGGLLALGDVFNQVHSEAIVTLAVKYKVPTVVGTRQMTESGGLLSYSVDIPDLFRRSAAYVDRILKGVKPSDLPIQRPDKFWTAINLKTAKTLSVTFAPHLLNNADEVIE
jgi:putative ABC transport system substrate-binding protein